MSTANIYSAYQTTVEGLSVPSPSNAAKSGEYAKLQANSKTVILDGFYNMHRHQNTSALPIEIYHPVFQLLVENIATARPDEEFIADVQKLMTVSTGVGTVELTLAEDLRIALTKVLGKYMGQVVVDDAIPDDTVRKTGDEFAIPLLVMEYKQAIDEGGCDPLTQGSHSALSQWRTIWVSTVYFQSLWFWGAEVQKLKEVRDKCCCPTFIIASGSPYLVILGAILREHFVVQRLTSLEWLGMGRVFEGGHLYHIAQIFHSLRAALQELDTFYDELKQRDLKLVDGQPHPRFYPYHTTFTDYTMKLPVEFEYLRPLTDSQKSLFLVKLKSSCETAVEFVARYRAAAHHLLAEAGVAPRLLFCGSIDGQDDVRDSPLETAKGPFGLHLGPSQMVAMGHVDGTNGEEAGDKLGDAHEQLRAIIDKLHESQYVFGDLRSPNVMFSGSRVVLIDLDWAGKHGETFYPTEIGDCITLHCNARDLGIIKKEHDPVLFNHYFPPT